ncbi:asparaginase [Cohnella endophytica]|uniref:Asparaginase n=1 Tax=Cohnella endophytica TaxID=2419778 RepID=A0A494X615_9BACL|nr:asparaginase [Cohnella endophytica]RKP45830.1 asparaginase [Cohnella endophytica]
MTIQDKPLIIMKRGGLTENVHRGRISIVSAVDGQTLHEWGDVRSATYVRSTAKPIQAIASLLDGAAEAYGYEERNLALMAASHRGSKEQIATLEKFLSLTGLDEDLLAIQPTMPVGRQARDEYAAAGGKPRKLFHTCAGKHLGVLAWSKLKGWPLEGYIHPDHPAQQEIVRRLKLWTGAEREQVTIGKDGCGFPVAAMPLGRLALAYGRLASPELAKDGASIAGAIRITAAMHAYPELVEGRYRLASILLEDPNVIAKSGAHGVFAFGLRKERLGVALAVSDGTEIAWPHIVKTILSQLGGISEDTRSKLESVFPSEFRNDAKELAGSWEATFDLT